MLFGKCCCDIVCCCVDEQLLPNRIPRKECKDRGGRVIQCPGVCQCPECVPTVTINGIEFPMNSAFYVITSICDRAVPPFGFPDTFSPLCVTGKIDKIRAWGAAYSYYDCTDIPFVYVEVWHAATIECDKGWQAGDLKVNTDLLVDNARWERRWRFYFQGAPDTDSLCWFGEGGPPLVTVEIEDTPNNFDLNDFSDLAAESQECHDLLITEPEISISCGSEEDLPAC